MPIAMKTRMIDSSNHQGWGDPNEVRCVGGTVLAKAVRQTRRFLVIAGVAATLGVTAVPAQAAQPTTPPGQAHGQQLSWSGASSGHLGHRHGHKLAV